MDRLLRLAHVTSIFASAFLLFLVEPMIAKMLLPRFGGSAAVWATCLVFFQALLLAGYGWSHLLSRMKPCVALGAQAALLLVAAMRVPPVAAAAVAPDAAPLAALLQALTLAVALPFFALSTNTSLVQHLYARRFRDEPWYLYAVSNGGSLLSLLAYPFVLERHLGLVAQGRLFAAGYAAFALATAVVLAAAWRTAPAATQAAGARDAGVAVPWTRRLRWLSLSAIASLLLVAVSVHVSTDVGAAPLLWVLPLAAYLVTFVLAFSPRVRFPRRVLAMALALFVTLALVLGHLLETFGIVPGLVVSLGVLFVGCWICHGELAADRPDGALATEFYLWIAAGGFVGGLFGSLVAPLVFQSVAEWPISLVLVSGVAVWSADRATLPRTLRKPAFWAGPAVYSCAIGFALIAPDRMPSAVHVGVLLIAAMFMTVPGQYFAAIVAVSVFVLAGGGEGVRVLASRRSFFGVVRIVEDGHYRRMLHGTTTHGMQRIDPPSPEPLAYYVERAPLSWVASHAKDGANIGVLGLGTGALAARVRAGQHLTFYEIDPIVEPAARRYFPFMNGSPADVHTVLGDGRLTIDGAADGSFDQLFLDVFSSDAIPNHLLTKEAFELYLRKVAPGGLLVAHVTNRHLDLVPLVHGDVDAVGAFGAVRRFVPTSAEIASGASGSVVVAIARTRAALAPLLAAGWTPLEDEKAPTVVWTDDRSSILDVLR